MAGPLSQWAASERRLVGSAFDSWRTAAALGWKYLEGWSAFYDPRRMRSWWLADMRQFTASYLRSPAFLSSMSLNIKAMTGPFHFKPPFVNK